MGFICAFPKNIEQANRNYVQAQQIYISKRKEIMNRIKSEYDVSGNEFVDLLQKNLKINMQQKIQSPDTGREVGYDTILKHLYDAVEKQARSIIDEKSSQITESVNEIQKIQNNARTEGKKAQDLASKEIDEVIQKFANEMQLNNIVYKYLPEFMSGENIDLSISQVFAYAKSIFKREITSRITGIETTEIIRRHPAIIVGYIREDATADAGQKAIKKLQMTSASAKTVGAEKSKIDIIIPLTGRATVLAQDNQMLKSILSNLDSADYDFSVIGESDLETNEFLGIQSKPWRLYLPTTVWNRNSVGSRAELLQKFKDGNPDLADNQFSWHSGVLYLSTQLEEVIGPNTVMYVTGNSILWTDDLFSEMRQRNKYFAFMLNSDHSLTSHVQIADHVDR